MPGEQPGGMLRKTLRNDCITLTERAIRALWIGMADR
jgi:hypothetical protein